jgi:hypothetical protein
MTMQIHLLIAILAVKMYAVFFLEILNDDSVQDFLSYGEGCVSPHFHLLIREEAQFVRPLDNLSELVVEYCV